MLSLLFPFLLTATSAVVLSDRQILGGSNVCQEIASNVTGEVYYSLDFSPNFSTDIKHYMSSSTQVPMCVVEVTDAQDVSNVMKIISSTRTPFAIKSGGHASNPGFSSTTGVLISLAKITEINLSEDKNSIEVGLGNVRSPT